MITCRMRPVTTLNKPRHLKPHICVRKHVVHNASPIDVTYLTGKTIILFTLFYTSLQWMQYRSLRVREEHDDKNDKNDKK